VPVAPHDHPLAGPSGERRGRDGAAALERAAIPALERLAAEDSHERRKDRLVAHPDQSRDAALAVERETVRGASLAVHAPGLPEEPSAR
jgi:hypothetical protein